MNHTQLLYMKQTRKLLLLLFVMISAQASSIVSPVSLALTIYNDRFAMVKDTRSITFDQGRSELFFTDVSSNIQPETVTFKAINQPQAIRIYQQNFEGNLVNTQAILQKYVNQQIEIYVKLGESSFKINGTLLGFNSGYILQTVDGIKILNNIEGIHLPSLPSGFFTVPTLTWKVFSNSSLTTNCEVAYRTTGFSWKSDYSITLNSNESRGDIGGWVTIDNRSGKRYSNATLKLIAGDVNTVSSNSGNATAMPMLQRASLGAAPAPSFSQKSFSDFHLYTLSQPVSLNDNSQKQVEFIPKVYDVPIRRYNLVSINSGGYSQANIKAGSRLQFQNIADNNLGIPFPKGTFRVFKTDDSDGSLQFIGEDSIGHTPKDQNITIKIGNSFDIAANKQATNYRSFSPSGYYADLNLTVFNHKDIQAEIVVELSMNTRSIPQITWKNDGFNIEKVSASLIRIKRVFKANQKFSYIWNESYRP